MVMHGRNRVFAVAHPSLIIKDKQYHLFFTARVLQSDTGGIGPAQGSNGLHWKFRRTAIREPFVQSHPCVFQWCNEYFLIPEAHTQTAVKLYKAAVFP
jgi:hypothetical protein